MKQDNSNKWLVESGLPTPAEMWAKLTDHALTVKANEFFEKSLFEKLQEKLGGERK